MATNLVISFPDIPEDALTLTLSATADTDQNQFNLIRGRRSQYFQLDAAGTSLTIDFDLGTGNTSTADHVIVARADELIANGMTQLLVRRGTDGVAWTTEYTDASFASATLRGPKAQDYGEEFTESSAYRYWRLDYTSTSQTLLHSKVYLGSFFDIGRDPADLSIERILSEQVFTAQDGTEYISRNTDERFSLSIVWEGVTDALTEAFVDKATHRHGRYCYLYALTDTAVLNGNKMIHCEVQQDSVRAEKVFNDYNTVSANFIEMVG